MDTTVLQGAHKFETDTLYKELHYQYFLFLHKPLQHEVNYV